MATFCVRYKWMIPYPSASNTKENVDDHQCRSIRMGMKSTPKLLCTNDDRPRACTKGIIEFRSL